MAQVLVAGALESGNAVQENFARLLGAEIVGKGHALLNGCSNRFDALVAEGADEQLKALGLPDEERARRITSYVGPGCTPAHNCGTVLRSRLTNWDLSFKRLYPPEQVHSANVVIIVGGRTGTLRAANWARIDHKPLLPVTAFGGAGEDVYNEEIKEFDTKYADRVERQAYETLNQISTDPAKIAHDAVALVNPMVRSRNVFVVMSFSGNQDLEDAYETFVNVCDRLGLKCSRISDRSNVERILPAIRDSIRSAAFIIADLSEARPNVYYELGFAEGLNKRLVLTAQEGSVPAFDIKDIPILYWNSQKQLRELLTERVSAVLKEPAD